MWQRDFYDRVTSPYRYSRAARTSASIHLGRRWGIARLRRRRVAWLRRRRVAWLRRRRVALRRVARLNGRWVALRWVPRLSRRRVARGLLRVAWVRRRRRLLLRLRVVPWLRRLLLVRHHLLRRGHNEDCGCALAHRCPVEDEVLLLYSGERLAEDAGDEAAKAHKGDLKQGQGKGG